MTRRARALGAGVVAALVLTVAGCGGGSDDGDRAGARPTDPTGRTETTDAGARAYEGLSEQAAIAKAEAAGSPWRITREDDESFMVTQDYVPNRLNFEIDDGTVTRATYG